MRGQWPRSRGRRWLLACLALTECGRIGYEPMQLAGHLRGGGTRDASLALRPDAGSLDGSAGAAGQGRDASIFDAHSPVPEAGTNVVKTALPPLPELTNVVVSQRNDSVGVDFDPVDGAQDYRIYPLPDDSAIVENADGSVTVQGATYRCSGDRQTWDAQSAQNTTGVFAQGLTTQFDSDLANDTLGYVYVKPASGLVPVYALGGVGPTAEGDELGWEEGRLKIYTADTSQRTSLLGQGWRDDGIVFYVPSSASSSTQTVYGSQNAQVVPGQGWTQYHQYYFLGASQSSHTKDTTPPAPAFQVLAAQVAGTVPLMSVFYSGRHEHTELVAGQERFQRAAYQGNGPLWHLEWSGITAPTTLVVEALDSGCPFQGFLSPQHIDTTATHQAFLTLDDLRAASPTGEVFVNGQHDPTSKPRAIARSFVTVAPQPIDPSAWDWYEDFGVGSTFGPVTAVPGCTDLNCGRWQTPDFDFSVYRMDKAGSQMIFTYGQFLGQFWVAYDDAASDAAGKVRFTARRKATVDPDASKYLHVTLSMDIVSTDRRFPQLIISDQDAPVQEGLANPDNNTLLVQPTQGPPMRFEVQAIHGLVGGKPWDADNEAPEHRFIDPGAAPLEPVDWPFEHAGMDRLTRFDVYVSSQQIYSFMDGKPSGCALYPAGFSLSGPVTVSFGDLLNHEGAADELVCSQALPYGFLHPHQCVETKRHFDDFGFKSESAAPVWDETLFPCRTY